MSMYEFLILLQVFALGWFACRIYTAYKITKAIKQLVEENGFTLEEINKDILNFNNLKVDVIKVPNMFTELSNNSILLYNKDTGTFVCQANTLDELAQSVYEYDKIKFANVKHNDKNVWFVEGKVKDNLKEI